MCRFLLYNFEIVKKKIQSWQVCIILGKKGNTTFTQNKSANFYPTEMCQSSIFIVAQR